MNPTLWQVDAFSTRPFEGNPAAVCLLATPAPDEWMQAMAREMNLSETAFVTVGESGGTFPLRWFTPSAEVALCGHATLASGWVLYESGVVSATTPIGFDTRSGRLTVRKESSGWIVMDFPATPVSENADALLAPLQAALRSEQLTIVGRHDDILVRVPSPQVLRALQPEWDRLARIEARGIIVTAPPDREDCDFLSRFFGPAVGVNEDPVTGSAHCTLGPYWSTELGRTELVGFQASTRGGFVRVGVQGNRVELAGPVSPVLRGIVLAPPVMFQG